MEPEIGSVFADWVDRWGRWGVRQFCGGADGERWWLDLDWFEPELPTDVATLEPLQQHRYGYDGRVNYVKANDIIPADWVLIGVREPLRSGEPWGQGSVHAPPSAAGEYEWLQHPQEQRDAYNRVRRSSERVMVAGEEVWRDAPRLPPRWMRGSAEELSQLVCAVDVVIDEDRPDLDDVLAGFPFLQQVTIFGPIDKVTLPHTVTTLGVHRGASAEMEVRGGSVAWLRADADLLIIESPDVTELEIFEIVELDLAELAVRYPRVRRLRLTGSPGFLTGLDGLTQLPDLRQLSLTDVFGFDTLPHLPRLETLRINSIPKGAGTQARKDFAGIDLEVTKLRTDAWMADNMGNPFRSWEGSEFVPAKYAKSAWTAYKKHRKALRDAANGAAEGTVSAAEFDQMVIETITTVAHEFNGWDKSGWIETVAREEIADAYFVLLTEVSDTYPVDTDAAMAALDAARDW